MSDLEALLRASSSGGPAGPPDIVSAAADAGLIDVAYVIEPSPVGDLLLAATTRGLVRVGYLDDGVEPVLEDLAARISPRVLSAPARLDPARRELEEFFAGRRDRFELALDWQLTRGFAQRVLRATARIPYGTVASYREVATAAGSPGAYRAAGTALSRNPVPIVVPCHRVLHTGGGLGGYTGGLQRKRVLLSVEGALREN
jgi:methylated-DNA-[protein]-cysteine S-methyltransferase